MQARYKTYSAFFSFYLGEHSNPVCRFLHYIGSTLALTCVAIAIKEHNAWWLLVAPICGYSFAWFGHFFIEKNKPATFTYPLWSLMGDYHMYFLFLIGALDKRMQVAQNAAPKT